MTVKPRWLWPAAFAGLTVALVVVALARGPVTLDPTTPEGVVQEYLRAVAANDYDAASELVDPDYLEDCSPADTNEADRVGSFTATLPRAAEPPASERAFVAATIRFSEGVFGPSWSSLEVFNLVARDGLWWITDDPWPYRWDCARDDLPPDDFMPDDFMPDDSWPDDLPPDVLLPDDFEWEDSGWRAFEGEDSGWRIFKWEGAEGEDSGWRAFKWEDSEWREFEPDEFEPDDSEPDDSRRGDS